MSRYRGRRAGALSLALALVLVLGACGSDDVDPYVDAIDMRPAADVLRDVDLAQVGIRAYECDLFEVDLARCYDSEVFRSIRAGREVFLHLHDELLDAGARYYGGSEHSRAADAPPVAGLDIGCYFDYQTADMALRVAIVGPTGEGRVCTNGLPGDGVSEVWIIGADFDVIETYERVEYVGGFQVLLRSVRRAPAPEDHVYGGDAPSLSGYYGPQLPARENGTGVHILEETVAVRDGVARGLIQFRGDGTASVDGGATGAWGVMIVAGNAFTIVPIVIREGESAPFEIALPAGTSVDDLDVLPSWQPVDEMWRGALMVDQPFTQRPCASDDTIGGEPIAALTPRRGEDCWVVDAQTTTYEGERFVVDALAALFNDDGTVYDVFDPYLLRADGGESGIGRLTTDDRDIAFAWVARITDPDALGVWMRYALVEDLWGSPAFVNPSRAD